jgi:O-antigen/teichoic acid export membrane protein
MFPKATVRHTNNQRSFEIISKSMLYMAALSTLAIIILYFFSEQIILILYGKEYISVAPLLAPFGLATAFFSLANIISYYQLSTSNSRFVLILIFSTVLEAVLMIIFHNTIQQIITTLVAASFLMLMLLIIEGLYSNRKRLTLLNPFSNQKESTQ